MKKNADNIIEDIVPQNDFGMVEPAEAYENWIPDQIFPVDPEDGGWEIPLLDDSMQAMECAIPMMKWGEQARTLDLKGNGTVHFYTDDYKMEGLWSNPAKLANCHPRNIVEPNFSLFLDMAPAFGLQAIYKKRVIARMMQDRGIRVFVDLNVAQKFIKLNLIGVPKGWRSFATRGYSDRLGGLELEYKIAETSAAFAGRKPLFVVYGGGEKCKDFCKEVGAIYITPNLDIKNREWKYDQLMKDGVIAFADKEYSREALEAGRTATRLLQVEDFGKLNQLNDKDNE